MVEELFYSQPWREIAFPVLQEMIAGATGRFTNGRYYHGQLTQDWKGESPLIITGYQKSLMDFYNSLHDFIVKRDKVIADKKVALEEEKAPLVDPFMENADA